MWIRCKLAKQWIDGGNGTTDFSAFSEIGVTVENIMIFVTVKSEFISSSQSATALVAATVIVKAIFVPLLTAYWFNYMKSKDKVVGNKQNIEGVQGSEMNLKNVNSIKI